MRGGFSPPITLGLRGEADKRLGRARKRARGKPKNFLAFFSRLLPPPLRREAEKNGKEIFGFASPRPCISYNNLEYNTTEYYDTHIMTKAIFSKDHKYTVDQLKKARLEAGLDQAEVAKLLGKTQPHISKIEAGQRRLDIIQIKEFAKIYKKDLSFFIK